mmetsp:Transcript_12780/g.21896  ORF Transcript_12780/g.21896 Transcript_12780/m.21896 type:complete len:209 (-) Transcript_12780:147-773(-)
MPSSFPNLSAQNKFEFPSNIDTTSSSGISGNTHSFLLQTPDPYGHTVLADLRSNKSFHSSGLLDASAFMSCWTSSKPPFLARYTIWSKEYSESSFGSNATYLAWNLGDSFSCMAFRFSSSESAQSEGAAESVIDRRALEVDVTVVHNLEPVKDEYGLVSRILLLFLLAELATTELGAPTNPTWESILLCFCFPRRVGRWGEGAGQDRA